MINKPTCKRCHSENFELLVKKKWAAWLHLPGPKIALLCLDCKEINPVNLTKEDLAKWGIGNCER
jgi:hypothetical protein